jgi:ABC-type multidrug transport system ATPase subunit
MRIFSYFAIGVLLLLSCSLAVAQPLLCRKNSTIPAPAPNRPNNGGPSDPDDPYSSLPRPTPPPAGHPCSEGLQCVFTDSANTTEWGYCFPCATGLYCPLDTFSYSDALTLSNICPAGYSCPNASQRVICPAGFVCEAGTIQPTSCPDEGVYCAEGTGAYSADELACPAGYYCPTPAEKILCPANHYCRKASKVPTKCNVLENCSEGAAVPQVLARGILIVATVIIGLLCSYLLYVHHHKRTLLKSQARVEAFHSSDNIQTMEGMLKKNNPCATSSNVMVRQETFNRLFQSFGVERPRLDLSFEQLGLRLVKTAWQTLPLKMMLQYGLEQTIQYATGLINRKQVQDISKANSEQYFWALKGVTGEFRHSRLSAILGGSGAGKTSLLNVLCGKSYYGHPVGSIKINGNPSSLHTFRSQIGFVPQDDVLHADLTVFENIYYNAMLRLPSTIEKSRKLLLVEEVLTLLEIKHISNSLVGSVEERGISGGQRRRVNIALELVANPSILFLDEPTSGLDATSAFEVLSCLQLLSRLGMTVIAVIHQPRYASFELFDDILLLGKGGETVYLGPPADSVSYFQSLGFCFPANENPCDILMDITAGDIPSADDPQFLPSHLPALWKQHQSNCTGLISVRSEVNSVELKETEEADKENSVIGEIKFHEEGIAMPTITTNTKDNKVLALQQLPEARNCPSFATQYYLFCERSVIKLSRTFGQVLFDFFLLAVIALCIGIIYGSNWSLSRWSPMSAMSSLAMGVAGAVVALRFLSSEQTVIWREASAGLNELAFFLSVLTLELPRLALYPLTFCAIYYHILLPRTGFFTTYVVYLAVFYSTAAIGMLVSVLFHRSKALLAAVMIPLLIGGFLNGANPTYASMNDSMRGLCALSYGRWAVEALTISEINLQPAYLSKIVAAYIEDWGWNTGNYSLDIGMLFIIGFVLRVITAACLVLMNRDKKA